MAFAIPGLGGIPVAAIITAAIVLLVVIFGERILFGILFGKAAKHKGYSGGGVFVLVFFFGFLGCLYAAALPDKIAQQQRDAMLRMQMGQFQPQPLQHAPQQMPPQGPGPQPQQPASF